MPDEQADCCCASCRAAQSSILHTLHIIDTVFPDTSCAFLQGSPAQNKAAADSACVRRSGLESPNACWGVTSPLSFTSGSAQTSRRRSTIPGATPDSVGSGAQASPTISL